MIKCRKMGDLLKIFADGKCIGGLRCDKIQTIHTDDILVETFYRGMSTGIIFCEEYIDDNRN